MRLNKHIAFMTGVSRRKADRLVQDGRVTINGQLATLGVEISTRDRVCLDGVLLGAGQQAVPVTTLALHKPVGYVVSRDGQGSATVYDLLPPEYHNLKPVGRLDKDSSGLLLLTNDGQLAYDLTHPSREKTKQYEVTLDKPLQPLHRQLLHEHGLLLDDGVSTLHISRLHDGDDMVWLVSMHEGRNRQIRRTFAALGYTVVRLHRTHFGPYALGTLAPARYIALQQPNSR